MVNEINNGIDFDNLKSSNTNDLQRENAPIQKSDEEGPNQKKNSLKVILIPLLAILVIVALMPVLMKVFSPSATSQKGEVKLVLQSKSLSDSILYKIEYPDAPEWFNLNQCESTVKSEKSFWCSKDGNVNLSVGPGSFMITTHRYDDKGNESPNTTNFAALLEFNNYKELKKYNFDCFKRGSDYICKPTSVTNIEGVERQK